MVRSVPITEVDDETLYALLRQGGEQFKAELAARPALSPTATVTDPAHERPAHLLDFAKRFYPGYEAGRLHEVMAAEIEAALSQSEPCPDCGDLECFACGGLRLTGEMQPCLLCWCDTCDNTGRVPSSSPYWLMVEVPPQHGKSELVSVQAPAWYLGNHPDHQWVQASYAANLAETHSRYSREIVSSADYDVLYGLRPSTRTNSVADWSLQGHRGGVRAVGVGGGLTGRRADVLVIDDPIANLVAAYSENTRETVWGWWRSVARTRLHPHSVVILVMTRWHYDDLAGRLLAEDKRTGRNRWRVVRIPARADDPADPLGRSEGQVAWPERFRRTEDAERFYTDLEQDVGPVEWSAMYQQRPTMAEGAMFKGEYWSYYDPHTDMPAERMPNRGFLYVVQLWDTAFKDKTRNDFNACVTFGVHAAGIFVLDVYNARHELPALLEAAAAQATKWGPTHLLAENKASGPSMVQMLRVAAQRTYVELWEPPMGADKVARAAAVIPMLSQRRVYLPRCTCGEWALPDPIWLNDFLAQLYQFPAGAHDDMVDSFTGGLHKVKELEDDYRRAQVASTYSGGGRGSVAARYIDRDTGAAPSPELVRRR